MEGENPKKILLLIIALITVMILCLMLNFPLNYTEYGLLQKQYLSSQESTHAGLCEGCLHIDITPSNWKSNDDIYGIHMHLKDGFTKTYYFSNEHEIHQEWQTGDALKVKWTMVKPFVYRVRSVENISLKQLR